MSESLQQQIEKIQQWGRDRKIIGNGTAEGQWLKLVSEFGEMADNVAKGKPIEDDIGDQFVVLCMILGICGNNLAMFRDEYEKGETISLAGDMPGAICETLIELQDLFFMMDRPEGASTECAIITRHLECLASLAGTTLHHCIEVAYADIKDRTGTLLENGVFVKD